MITEQDITIYTKVKETWVKMDLKGTFRNTSIKNRTQTGVQTNDVGVVRIFENIELTTGDVLINKKIDDDFESITKLREIHGKHNVFTIKSIDNYFLGTELDHIKIGLI